MNYKTLLLTALLGVNAAAFAMGTDTTSTSTSSDSSSSSSSDSGSSISDYMWGNRKEESRIDELFCLEK